MYTDKGRVKKGVFSHLGAAPPHPHLRWKRPFFYFVKISQLTQDIWNQGYFHNCLHIFYYLTHIYLHNLCLSVCLFVCLFVCPPPLCGGAEGPQNWANGLQNWTEGPTSWLKAPKLGPQASKQTEIMLAEGKHESSIK